MPKFPSKEWCEEVITLINSDPESGRAGEGWHGDFGLVIDSEPGKLEKPFSVHVDPVGGKIKKILYLRDPDELDEIEPAYLIRAGYSVWKGMLLGTVDPVEAVLRQKISVKGPLQPLIERLKHKGIADRILLQLKTEFVA